MSKKSKTIALVIILVLSVIFLINIFNSTNSTTQVNSETPWFFTLLVSWAPIIVIIILYFIFIGQMKQLLEKVERIAISIEKYTEDTSDLNEMKNDQ